MADQPLQEMYASELDPGVGAVEIISACVEGAQHVWSGEVRYQVEDGQPTITFYRPSPSGDIVVEAYRLAIAEVERRLRLVTVQLVDNSHLGGPCGWAMHCFAVEQLNRDPASPASGQDARRVFLDSQGHFLSYSPGANSDGA